MIIVRYRTGIHFFTPTNFIHYTFTQNQLKAFCFSVNPPPPSCYNITSASVLGTEEERLDKVIKKYKFMGGGGGELIRDQIHDQYPN